MRYISRFTLAALAASALMSCAPAVKTALDKPNAGEEYVSLQQSFNLGALTVTPLRVLEDSRCPLQTNCVWAGRLIVETLVVGPHWQQTVDLNLGEAQVVDGFAIRLSGVIPEGTTEGEEKPDDYRFAFALSERN
ncbi:hypothetical protein G7A66_00265 [Altererythrobacter sp. SALINAS58]|uniref:hypothetical protein n=1 Tax=Alteripontixanthobacter muriae TaxID=2705546 RepID=UPI001576A736|nr:hypothetical protein [Alteripontixanthobacter muriae]NTZ41547.1 hypothetical protein [Alteripontixanthobacter muriae]